jgi:hypothetical protein
LKLDNKTCSRPFPCLLGLASVIIRWSSGRFSATTRFFPDTSARQAWLFCDWRGPVSSRD